MRGLILALISVALAAAVPVKAEDAPPTVKGIYLLADFPSLTVRPGTTSTVNLRLQNYAVAPELLELKVEGTPAGWTASRSAFRHGRDSCSTGACPPEPTIR